MPSDFLDLSLYKSSEKKKIMNEYVILIGSNIDAENNLSRAIAILSCITTVIQISKAYQTQSIKKGLPTLS